jgi:hypothetical protein
VRGGWAALLLVACGPGSADIQTMGTTTLVAPDIDGDYVAEVTQAEGCDGLEGPLEWMNGDLVVEGPPEALVFRFDGGEQVTGSVDAAFEVVLADTETVAGDVFVVSGVGLAYIDAGLWVLDVSLQVDVTPASSEFPDCSVVAGFQAGQVAP